jgi:hypothetical protein
MTEAGYLVLPAQRLLEVNLNYPLAGRDTAKSGIGGSITATYTIL